MVNTFVPRFTFVESLMTLDWKRLGNQRVETKQLLRALTGETRGWSNSPAARMWRGHEGALAQYGSISCRLWVLQHGYEDNLLPYFEELEKRFPNHRKPMWWGDARVHISHQSNLVRKDRDWYGPQFPYIPDNLPYFWPR